MNSKNEYLTITQALEIIPLSRATFTRAIYAKKIKAVKLGGKWLISQKEINRILERGFK